MNLKISQTVWNLLNKFHNVFVLNGLCAQLQVDGIPNKRAKLNGDEAFFHGVYLL